MQACGCPSLLNSIFEPSEELLSPHRGHRGLTVETGSEHTLQHGE